MGGALCHLRWMLYLGVTLGITACSDPTFTQSPSAPVGGQSVDTRGKIVSQKPSAQSPAKQKSSVGKDVSTYTNFDVKDGGVVRIPTDAIAREGDISVRAMDEKAAADFFNQVAITGAEPGDVLNAYVVTAKPGSSVRLTGGDILAVLPKDGALPASAIPASAIPSNALPASALPASAIPSNGLPASALPASALPVSALPASALPSGTLLGAGFFLAEQLYEPDDLVILHYAVLEADGYVYAMQCTPVAATKTEKAMVSCPIKGVFAAPTLTITSLLLPVSRYLTMEDRGVPMVFAKQYIDALDTLNRAPTITISDSFRIPPAKTSVIELTASDPDGDFLLAETSRLPEFARRNYHYIVLDPPRDAEGKRFLFTLEVRDNGNPSQTAKKEITIEVAANSVTAPDTSTDATTPDDEPKNPPPTEDPTDDIPVSAAPISLFSSKPTPYTAMDTVLFAFSSDDATASYSCSEDGGGYLPCESPYQWAFLSEGSHNFSVKAKDVEGNEEFPALSYDFVVDYSVPTASFLSTPAASTSLRDATFSFQASEGSVTLFCSLDSASYVACTSPYSKTNLADGSHTLSIKAKDRAGNMPESGTIYSWLIDATKPVTTITPSVGAFTSLTSATMNFGAEGGSTYECFLNGIGYGACTSPFITPTLSPGSHTFSVQATDAVGNIEQSAASFSWVQDAEAPAGSVTIASTFPEDPAFGGDDDFSHLTGSSVAVHFQATDNYGVTRYCAKANETNRPHLGDACWRNVSSTTSFNRDATVDFSLAVGDFDISVWFADAAGNISNPTTDSGDYLPLVHNTWVAIPAGSFMMGDGGTLDESPVHTVNLSAFSVLQFKVSAGDFAACVNAGGCAFTPPAGGGASLLTYEQGGKVTHPMNYATWAEARTFCNWIGGDLPTEAQWEYLARGASATTYPWGNTAPNAAEAAVANCNSGSCGDAFGDTSPVDAFQSTTSPFGAKDLLGNLREWVRDYYLLNYYNSSPSQDPVQMATDTGQRGVRGFSFGGVATTSHDRSGLAPTASEKDIGFRCVK